MPEETKYDYSPDLDALHIYSSKINKGVKGCITFGDYTIDIGYDNSVVGVEIEQASALLKLSEANLKKLDSVSLIARKVGNMLFIGFAIVKNKKESTIEFSVPAGNLQIKMPN